VEALITADEETGMFGANGLPAGELNGDILLNLDSETWGKFVIGSAGGINVTATLDYQEVETDPEDAALRITLKGLRGGHSGLEIHEGRANANKLMVRFVREAIEECEARLASWHGGNMRNAIPFKAEVILTLPKENVLALKELVDAWKEDFIDEYKGIESSIEFYAEEVETPKMQVPVEIQDNLVDAIYACHDGVVRMIPAYPDVVETSSNLAIIDIADGSTLIKLLPRSSREDMKDYIVKMIESCFNMAGMKIETSGSYGGWDPNPDSEILHLLLKVYKELNGEDGIIQVDHAGLECSIILGKYPHLDVVSLGPTMKSPHTTTERALWATVEPFWALLKKTLEEIPVK
jgi:dipeptidase D